MGKKKHRLTQSQINGISWIAIALAVSLALYFFSRTIDFQPTNADIHENDNQIRLENFEDSIYHSRRPNRTFLRNTIQNQHHKSIKTDSLYTSEPPAPVRKPLMVELNSADSTTLQLLHGIGPAFARRIVRYREKLGGFSNKEQLLEVYGFTPSLLEHIEPYLQLDSSNLRKININSIELKQLIKHPYTEYYFARDLVNLRSRGVTFTCPDDLRAIPSCTDTMLSRLLPYLDFGL